MKRVTFNFEVLEAIAVTLVIIFFGPAFCFVYLSLIEVDIIFDALIVLANLGLAYVAFAARGDWKKRIELEKSMEVRSVVRLGKVQAQLARRYGSELSNYFQSVGVILPTKKLIEFRQQAAEVKRNCEELLGAFAPHLNHGHISEFAVNHLHDAIALVDIAVNLAKNKRDYGNAKQNISLISPNLVKVIEIFDEISKKGDVKYEFSEFKKKEDMRKNSN